MQKFFETFVSIFKAEWAAVEAQRLRYQDRRFSEENVKISGEDFVAIDCEEVSFSSSQRENLHWSFACVEQDSISDVKIELWDLLIREGERVSTENIHKTEDIIDFMPDSLLPKATKIVESFLPAAAARTHKVRFAPSTTAKVDKFCVCCRDEEHPLARGSRSISQC